MNELCRMEMPSGARCTMPAGHSGDHIAESVRRGNIIDSSREAVDRAEPEQAPGT
jgi:hypothetical protein